MRQITLRKVLFKHSSTVLRKSYDQIGRYPNSKA